MATLRRARQNEQLDLMAWQENGRSGGYVEDMLTNQYNLCEERPRLPLGLVVLVPPATLPPTNLVRLVSLYD